jgi:hypothetical protein
MWRLISRFIWRAALVTLVVLIPGAFLVGAGAVEGICIELGLGLICATWMIETVEFGLLPAIALVLLIVLIRRWRRRQTGLRGGPVERGN